MPWKRRKLLDRRVPVVIFASLLFIYQAYPHESSSFTYRVTNRRYISRILLERIGDRDALTLITTHPGPWAFHSTPHALHYFCKIACLSEMKRLDAFLQTGYNIGMRLSGSVITDIVYFDP
jgi:hypothetical protein